MNDVGISRSSLQTQTFLRFPFSSIMKFQVAAIVLVVFGTCYAHKGIPALLLSSRSHQFDEVEVPSAGQIKSTDKFGTMLGALPSTDLTVIFQQDEMTAEDFLRRDAQRKTQTVYPQLSKLTRAMESVYFPMVKAPTQAIKNLEVKHSNIIRVAAGENIINRLTAAKLAKGTLVVITLPSTTNTEVLGEQLAKIDGLIAAVLATLNELKNSYTAIYTGLAFRKAHEDVIRAASRHLLQASETADGPVRIVAATSCFTLLLDNLKINTTQFPNSTTVVVNPAQAPCGNTVNATLNGPTSTTVKMNFRLAGTFWGLELLTVDDKVAKLRNSYEPIGGYKNQSYHCLANSAYDLDDGRVLSYTRIQVEPFGNGQNFGSSYPNDCIGVFTGPLLSSLFITLILLSITCIGTGLLANIASNDRFDDPKGTPLAVTVSE